MVSISVARTVLVRFAALAATATFSVPVSATRLSPTAVACALLMLIPMVWLALAPTWKFWPAKVPSSRFLPLNWLVVAIRLISDCSWDTSACSAVRSLEEFVSLADCTASSRMRWSALVVSTRAPSAVCAREMPSLALRAAWFKPRIWEVKRSEMARPAASSRALLMRKPEDKRCKDVCKALCDLFRLRCAFSDSMLVLMIAGILILLINSKIRFQLDCHSHWLACCCVAHQPPLAQLSEENGKTL